jgi:hypothetical protein
MEFSFKIDGVYHDFRAKDPVEAAELIRQLAKTTSCDTEKDPVSSDSATDIFGDRNLSPFESVLNGFRGTKTAKFVKLLASLDGFGAPDSVLKQKMSTDNLAPYVTSIIKACKRIGLDDSSIFERKQKRVRAGKVLYHYRLTDTAANFVNAIPDFENDLEFGGVSPAVEETNLLNQSSTKHEPVSIRDKVRDAARNATVTDICRITGLSKRQVNGVVNAPSEGDKFDRHGLPNGEKTYTYVGNRN